MPVAGPTSTRYCPDLPDASEAAGWQGLDLPDNLALGRSGQDSNAAGAIERIPLVDRFDREPGPRLGRPGSLVDQRVIVDRNEYRAQVVGHRGSSRATDRGSSWPSMRCSQAVMLTCGSMLLQRPNMRSPHAPGTSLCTAHQHLATQRRNCAGEDGRWLNLHHDIVHLPGGGAHQVQDALVNHLGIGATTRMWLASMPLPERAPWTSARLPTAGGAPVTSVSGPTVTQVLPTRHRPELRPGPRCGYRGRWWARFAVPGW